jgi:hypothetical protein
MLKVLSGFIVDNEFVLIDKNPPFSAADWEPFEEALGDEKIMTRLLTKHKILTKLPGNIDTVIVLAIAHFKEIQAEAKLVNSSITVIRYADVLAERL